MAKTAIWGEVLKVNLDVGFKSNIFKLDSSVLDGTDALEGSTEFVDITEYVQSSQSIVVVVTSWILFLLARCQSQLMTVRPVDRLTR